MVSIQQFFRKRGHLLIHITIAIGLFVFFWPSISFYLSATYVPGWDGQGHASVAEYYAKNIYPAFWGWIPVWYGGMPFPQFYPPVFYFILATLYTLFSFLGFDIAMSVLFKIFIVTLSLGVVPLTGWFIYSLVKNKTISILASIITVPILLLNYDLGNPGIDFEASVYAGLVTQLLAYYWFIFLFYALIYKKHVLAAIFLALVALTNVHFIPAVAMIYGAIFINDLLSHRWDRSLWMTWRDRVVGGLIAIGLSAFWSYPMIAMYDFFITKNLRFPGTLSSLFDLQGYWLAALGALVISWYTKRSDLRIISIWSVLVLMLYTFSWYLPFNFLPSHPIRWIAPVLILIVPVALTALYIALQNKKPSTRIALVVIAIIVVYTQTTLAKRDIVSFHQIRDFSEVTQLYSFFKNVKGRMLTEYTGHYNQPSGFILEPLLGANGNDVATTVFRESAIGTFYFTPIRNSLSRQIEVWGFDSYLAADPDYLNKSAESKITQAKNIGITWLAIRSAVMKDAFSKNPDVTHVTTIDKWNIYKINQPATSHEVLEKYPIPLYGALGFKDRDIHEYTWTRLHEELIYQNKTSELVFIYPEKQYLDEASEIIELPLSVLLSYPHKDVDRAITTIKKALSEGAIIFAQNDGSAFYNKLVENVPITQDLFNPNIQQGTLITFGEIHPPKEAMASSTARIISKTYVEKNKNILQPSPVDEQTYDASGHPNGGVLRPLYKSLFEQILNAQQTIHASSTQSRGQYTLWRQSYFPSWKAPSGIYLASPSFIVTKNNEVPMWEVDSSVEKGAYITIGSIAIFAFFAYARRKRLI